MIEMIYIKPGRQALKGAFFVCLLVLMTACQSKTTTEDLANPFILEEGQMEDPTIEAGEGLWTLSHSGIFTYKNQAALIPPQEVVVLNKEALLRSLPPMQTPLDEGVDLLAQPIVGYFEKDLENPAFINEHIILYTIDSQEADRILDDLLVVIDQTDPKGLYKDPHKVVATYEDFGQSFSLSYQVIVSSTTTILVEVMVDKNEPNEALDKALEAFLTAIQ